MTRTQAEHLLEAYVLMECDAGNGKARKALREVILDAMTTAYSYPYYINYTQTGTGYKPEQDLPFRVTCSEINGGQS